MIKLGLDGKLYRNTGSYAVPVWVELTNVKDVTLNLENGEADVTTRANQGWRATAATLKEGSVEFEMAWDTEDAGFTAIQNAWFNGTAIELAVMDGDITEDGTQGLRASFAVLSFSRNEPLEEAMSVNVTVKPTYAANAPAWMTVGGGQVSITFDVALTAGAATLDLTAIPYGSGTYDATGKKVVELTIVNKGANGLTVSEGAANGYDLFALGDDIAVPALGTVRNSGTGGAVVAVDAKTLDLVGTGTETSTWTVVLA